MNFVIPIERYLYPHTLHLLRTVECDLNLKNLSEDKLEKVLFFHPSLLMRKREPIGQLNPTFFTLVLEMDI